MNDQRQVASRWGRMVVFSAVGLGMVLALWSFYGEGTVGEALAAADRRLLAAALGLFCLQIPLLALRWWWVLRLLGMDIRFSDILAAHCGAAVTNFAVPGHFGEAVLSAWLERTGRAPGVEAFTALVACKVLTLLVSLGLLAVGVIGSPSLVALRVPAVALVLVGVAGVVIGLRLVGGDEVEGKGVRRLLSRARATLGQLGRKPAALAAGLGLTVANAALLVVVLALVYAAAGAPLGPMDAILLRGVDTVGHLFAGWIPGNLGVDEAVLTLASHHGLGVDGPLALGAAFLHKGVVAGYVAVAACVFLAAGRA